MAVAKKEIQMVAEDSSLLGLGNTASLHFDSVGIVGEGSFGRLAQTLVKRFFPNVTVKTYRRRHSPNSLEEVTQCDVLILAVPIRAYRDVLCEVVPHMRSGTAIVDVATVKDYTVGLLQEHAAGCLWIATHPMFGPGSYEKRNQNINGFPIVVCGHTLPQPIYEKAETFIKGLGFRVIRMTPSQHDVILAETLFITHLVGHTLKRAKFLERTEIDTPSVHLLKDAADIVQNDIELFKDVVQYNKHCRTAMVKWHQAQSWIWDLIVEAM